MLKKIRALKSGELNNYVAVFGLVAVSGFPFFVSSVNNSIILMLFVLIIFLKRSILFNTKCLGIIGAFFIVEMLHHFFIYPVPLATMIGTLVRLSAAFLVISICDKKFTYYYVNLMYCLAIISFIFFLPSILSVAFKDFFINVICPYFTPIWGSNSESSGFYVTEPTIIIYTFHEALQEFRNSGPFWEPGAFSVFLNIALMFNIINTKALWNKKNIYFAIAIISTLSTTGFLAFFVIVASFYLVKEKISKSVFIFALFFPIVVFLFFNLEFLNSKISTNMELKDNTTSRFGSAAADLKDFVTSPLIGWGKGEMRYGGRPFTFFTVDQHRNNGLTSLLVTYGIVVFTVLLYNYLKTLTVLCLANNFNRIFALLFFIVILMLGFGEPIFQYPFFYSIMFIHLFYTKEETFTIGKRI